MLAYFHRVIIFVYIIVKERAKAQTEKENRLETESLSEYTPTHADHSPDRAKLNSDQNTHRKCQRARVDRNMSGGCSQRTHCDQ